MSAYKQVDRNKTGATSSIPKNSALERREEWAAALGWEFWQRASWLSSGVVFAMAVLGLVATWIPARRALSVDPLVLLLVLLREE